MRRILGTLLLSAGILAGVVASLGAGGTSGNARVDAVFDNAGFLVAGQDVRIAGANVGKVKDVVLTPERHARVEMEIDPSFVPFRADADCTVQPQSLIGERFVQCTPGTSKAKPLPDDDGTPTVPIANTHSPVDLDIVLSAFRGAAPQRLGLLLSSLGGGLAGRGDDLNTIIRRANPALQQTANTLKVVNDSRADVRSLITGADTVIGRLADRRRSIDRFIKAAGDLTTTTAARKQALQTTIEQLPGLLEDVQPYLDEVTRTARQGGPALDDLQHAISPTRRLLTQVDGLTTRTGPALQQLRKTSQQVRGLLPASKPVLSRASRTAKSALPAGQELSALLTSSQQQGALEGLQRFVYYGVAATARYDANSHLLGAYPVAAGACDVYASTPVAGCSSNFASFGGQPAAAEAQTQKQSATPKKSSPATPSAPSAPSVTVPNVTVPQVPATPALPKLPVPNVDIPKAVTDALHDVTGVLGGAVPKVTAPPAKAEDPSASLLDFLLGS